MEKMFLAEVVNLFFGAVWLIMFARILLTWFPNISWYEQPFKFIYIFTKPIFEPFRKIVPPLNGIDISPILAFIVLGVIQKVVLAMVITF